VAKIHPLAVVSPKAELGQNVEIGPFAIVEDDVRIGDGTVVASHAVIKQGTVLGPGNQIFEAAVLGGLPQYLKMPPQLGGLVIGANNVIRENVTIHRAVTPNHNTTIGSGVFLMGTTHVGHDCQVSDHVIMAQGAVLGGHVTVGERAFVSGLVAVHQFCRIGKLSMCGGLARIVQDVPPYVMIDGTSHRVVGLNRVGLKRNGFTPADFLQLKAAYRLIFRSGLRWVEVLEKLKTEFASGPAAIYNEFFAGGTRGFVHERRTPRGATLRLDADAAVAEDPHVLRVRAG
jgi:UDP-N-acetylglucosamine acyltransferase